MSNPTTTKGPGPIPTVLARRAGGDLPPVGAIVGAIVGSVVAGITLISLTLFLLWRYKRHFGASDVRTPLHLAVSPFQSHPAFSLGQSVSTGYRDILINPSLQDGLGPRMQSGAVTKPPDPLLPPLVSTATIESAMQRGPVTKPSYPSSPPLASSTDPTQSTPVGVSQHTPSAGPSSGPELNRILVNAVTHTASRQELGNQEGRISAPHQDSGLRFGEGTTLSDIPPSYTES